MKSTATLRRWPTRNFLAELEPEVWEPHALDDLARRDPRLRQLYRKVKAASIPIRARVRADAWTTYSDARSAAQTADFELSFNLGYENGFLAGRAATRHGGKPRRDPTTTRLDLDLRRLMAGTRLTAGELLAVLLEQALALALAP